MAKQGKDMSVKQEPVFDLIKSMSKAEKRNFKLYATRLSGNQEAKFVALFDYLDSADEYDEARVLAKCPVKKEQLPNMKAHLYRQILVSIRLLNVQHALPMILREQIDFARILYDKGLYRQSVKILDKAKEQALEAQLSTIAIDIISFKKKIETLNISRGMISVAESMEQEISAQSRNIADLNELSTIAMQLYSLYLKLGYVRTQKDRDLITQYFKDKISRFEFQRLSFQSKVAYCQTYAWYYYIQHDFLGCYRYACRWVDLFDANSQMKSLMYDEYLRGYSRLLDGLFLMRSYKRLTEKLDKLEDEYCDENRIINDNCRMLLRQILFTNRLNRHFMEGAFAEGMKILPEMEEFIAEYDGRLDIHHKMLLYYKMACLCFGNGNYKRCMQYLSKVISTRDPQIRRDLQCYARILNLICSYEAGIDYNIDYQIRSVYTFLKKMNDMQQVQREMMAFLKRLNSVYVGDVKDELKDLYGKLKPYEKHPYERRTFYYLDVLSWLESKISGVPVAEIIRRNFEHDHGK